MIHHDNYITRLVIIITVLWNWQGGDIYSTLSMVSYFEKLKYKKTPVKFTIWLVLSNETFVVNFDRWKDAVLECVNQR